MERWVLTRDVVKVKVKSMQAQRSEKPGKTGNSMSRRLTKRTAKTGLLVCRG
jgi:hypothetical protein